MARSRQELENIIARGESVLLPDGRVVTRKEDLPSAVELAGDDIVKKSHAIGDLEAQRAALDAQIAAAKAAPETPSPAPEPPVESPVTEPETPDSKPETVVKGVKPA